MNVGMKLIILIFPECLVKYAQDIILTRHHYSLLHNPLVCISKSCKYLDFQALGTALITDRFQNSKYSKRQIQYT